MAEGATSTAPVQVTRVQHISLNVRDLEETTSFYTDILGLRLMTTRPDLAVEGVWLECPDGREVHLIVVDGHVAPKGQHFAFEVADLDDTVAALSSAGVRTGAVTEVPNGARQTFVKDPSDNLVEFNQAPRVA